MSGVLQRLAGRAIGQTGARLHALAQLPFQSPPGAIAQPNELQDQTSPSVRQHVPAQRLLPQTADAATAATAATTVSQHTTLMVRNEHELRAEPIDHPAPTTAAQPEKAHTAGSAHQQPRQYQATVDRSVQTSPLALNDATPEPMFPEVPPVAAPQATQTQPAAAAEPQALAKEEAKLIGARIMRAKPDQTPGRTKVVTEPSLANIPEALLPQSQAPQRAQPSATSHKALPAREPDEVHVHIGRVEITAIQEAAPAKHSRRKGQAPLSLDDYLARRKGDSA